MNAANVLPFTKMQAVGNDFVVVESDPAGTDTDWPGLAIRLCDRHFGIGADGLIVVAPSAIADVRMLFFNPDGTPDICGNGLRCVAAFASAHNRLTFDDRGNCYLESMVGVHRARMAAGAWAIHMGKPLFAPSDVPIDLRGDNALNYLLTVESGRIEASSVSTGTPHTVFFVDALPTDEAFERLGPQIENHPIFPDRTSVIWAAPDPDFKSGEGYCIRIWERGVGETLGCGTGACAVAVLANATGRSSEPAIWVESKGGSLMVGWSPERGDTEMVLTGPAEIVYVGQVSVDAAR